MRATNNEIKAEIQRGRVGKYRAFRTDREGATPIIIIEPVQWLRQRKRVRQREDNPSNSSMALRRNEVITILSQAAEAVYSKMEIQEFRKRVRQLNSSRWLQKLRTR